MASTKSTTEIDLSAVREGDVFHFQYSAEAREKAGGFDLNWAFDGQLVMRNGRLCDTYWGFDGSEPRSFTPAEAASKGTLTFIVNLDDVRDVRQEEQRHYDQSDCFNLSYQHGCYKRFSVRKDAKRSTARMLAEVEGRIAEVKHDTAYAVTRGLSEIERLTKIRARVESGDEEVTLWW